MTYCLGVLLPEGLVLASDATMRSNLSVDAPIDLLRYRADSFSSRNFATLEGDATYWMALR